MAGIEAYEEAEAVEHTRLLETARGGRPQVQHDVGRAVDLKLRGTAYKVTVYRTGPARFRVSVAEPSGQVVTVEADLERIGHFASRVSVGGRTHRLVTASHGPVQLVEVDGVTHRVSRDEGGILRSPAPALVVATPLAVGDEVAAGAPVLVLESMKMETVLPAPFAARLKELHVATGSQVETGAALARLEPTGGDDRGARPRRPPRRPTSTCPPTSSTATSPSARCTPAPTSPRCCSATTSTRDTRRAPWPATSRPATSWPRPGAHRSPTRWTC